MRKIKLFSVLTLLLLSLSALFGCASFSVSNKNPFSVFEENFTAETEAVINGSHLGFTCKRNNGDTEILLTSPSNICGYSFLIGTEKTTLSFGDVKSETQGRMSFLPETVTALFSSSFEEITEIKAEKTEGGSFTVVKTPSVTFRFNGSGSPAYIEGIINGAEIKITFKSFSAAPPSEEQGAA